MTLLASSLNTLVSFATTAALNEKAMPDASSSKSYDVDSIALGFDSSPTHSADPDLAILPVDAVHAKMGKHVQELGVEQFCQAYLRKDHVSLSQLNQNSTSACAAGAALLQGSAVETYDGIIHVLNTLSKAFHESENWTSDNIIRFVDTFGHLPNETIPRNPKPDICGIWDKSNKQKKKSKKKRTAEMMTGDETETEDSVKGKTRRDQQEPADTLQTVPEETSKSYKWHQICTAVEVKTTAPGHGQAASYGLYFTQAKPEYFAMLGVSASKSGYELLYVGGRSIHCSEKVAWDNLEPLRLYIARLYDRPFRNPLLVTYPRKEGVRRSFTLLRLEGAVHVVSDMRAQGGRGRRRFTGVLKEVGEVSYQQFMKGFYNRPFASRFDEGEMMARAHRPSYIPGLNRVSHYGYVPDQNGGMHWTHGIQGEDEEQKRNKEALYMLVTDDVGRSFEESRTSVYQILRAMYDILATLCNLFHRGILHRDISMNNLMLSPLYPSADPPSCPSVEYDPESVPKRYIKEVLGEPWDGGPTRLSEGLVIDLGCAADLRKSGVADAELTSRTGTPRYMARSVKMQELQERPHRKPMSFEAIPQLDQPKLSAYRQPDYDLYNETLGKRRDVAEAPNDVTFRHRLFHDAESALLVLSWLLVRSVPQDSQDPETNNRFYDAACAKHFHPNVDPVVPLTWNLALHSGLADLKMMIEDMHDYIWPEWAYRTDVTIENHAHEALMRLLLVEIVRMKDSKQHIPLSPILRPLPEYYTKLGNQDTTTPTSTSKTKSETRGSGKNSATGVNAPSDGGAASIASNNTRNSERLKQAALNNLATMKSKPPHLTDEEKEIASSLRKSSLRDKLLRSVEGEKGSSAPAEGSTDGE